MLRLILFLVPALMAAQTTGQKIVDLTWDDLLNPAGTTYSVYRATGLCSGTPVGAKLGTGVVDKLYSDETVIPGNYCYWITATFNGVESARSNMVAVSIPTFPPDKAKAVVRDRAAP